MSIDANSNKSDQSDKQANIQKRMLQLATRKSAKNQKFNYSLQCAKNDNNNITIQENQPIKHLYKNQIRSLTTQIPPQPNQSYTNMASKKKLMQQFSQQKLILQQQLTQKTSQILKLKSSMKGFHKNLKCIIQEYLQQFYQNVCVKNMLEIQKTIKKYQQKVKNVKKGAMIIKDKQQQRKSMRLLQYGKQRRSVSKSRHISPAGRNTSKLGSSSRQYIGQQSKSRSKIGVEQNKKEFQQIANKYEDIIKSNNEQIQKWDKKYRLKQRQCYQLKMRVDILQKKLCQESKKIYNQNYGKCNQRIITQSDLLQSDQEKINNFNVFEQEVLKMQTKVQQITTLANQKTLQITNLQNLLLAVQNKNKALSNQYKDNLTKSKQKSLQQQQKLKKQYQKIISQKSAQICQYKNSLMVIQKKFLQKQCQAYSLQSKIKKLDGLIISKDKKIQELDKMVTDNCPFDRSIMMSSIGNSEYNSQAIKKLKIQIEELEEKLQNCKNEAFEFQKKNNYYKSKNDELQRTNVELRKQIQMLHIENQQLKINAKVNSVVQIHNEVQQVISKKGQGQNSDENNQKLNIQLQAMNQKNNQLSRQKQQWYNKYQKIKNQNIQKQTQNIKYKSQLNFIQKQLSDSQQTFNHLKSENQFLKSQNKQLENKLSILSQQFSIEKQQLMFQLNEIQKKFSSFKSDLKQPSKSPPIQVDQSDQISLCSDNQKAKMTHINTQNEYLTAKLKQAKAELETHKIIQQKIIDEYKLNMQQYKIDIRNKNQQIRTLKQQIDDQTTKIINLTIRLQAISKNQTPNNKNNIQLKNQLLQRIQQLQAQLKQTKQINNKLTDMQSQLFDQIKIKQQQRAELYDQLRKKQTKIQQLQQIIQVRGGQVTDQPNIYLSHISQSTHKKDSIKSQSSLKYSSHSQILKKSRMMMNSGKSGPNHEQKLFDLDLSEAGSQFYDQPSQISNISQFFEKQQYPYQKIRIKRQQQIKLFQKTASYIKSLKKAIQQKNKKIKLLQKKIQSLKHSQLVRKQLGIDIDIKQTQVSGNNNLQPDDDFRDYQSVQLEYRRGGHLRKYKQLQHDTKLVMEENNMLSQQIQTLQQQLLKAQEQQNSLVKIKDLYKEEIKKLIKKNEQQSKTFQEEIKNQRKKVQESQSIHNLEAIKQLYTKIIGVVGVLFNQDNMNSKKKEERRKEIQQYIKVMSNILKLDKKAKQSILQCIHK